MDIEPAVAAHYTRGGLEATILDALRAAGKDIDALDPADLSGVDEFHLGWLAQTEALAREIGLAPGMAVLDIGAGIGGPARVFAAAHGCQVSGIDLTEEFVQVANALTRRCRLADRVSFEQASALALPFGAGAFDAATLIHVGMNIADKAQAFAEARRVLKPGGVFGVYDVMAEDAGAISYPMPWAMSPATSFVASPAEYRRLLGAAGFAIEKARDRSAFCRELGGRMREAAARDGPPPLGLHTILGEAARERLGNVMSALERGIIAPTELIARAI